MWTKSKLDKTVTRRWTKLGKLGEMLAELNLQKNGFESIKNLNQNITNNPYADLYAIRNDQAYVISVKARNKYEKSGVLNGRYKLGKDCCRFAQSEEVKFRAKAAWIVISLDVDKNEYSAYFGLLASLNGNTGVPMSEKAVKEYEPLCIKRDLQEDSGVELKELLSLKNKYQPK